MTSNDDPKIDWNLTTWKGSRLQQHREFDALPFRRKLENVEELSALARRFETHRQQPAETIHEDPPAPPQR